jgi:pseudouridine-5'-phosphate glycosidase
MKVHIDKAIHIAAQQNIKGKALTPFLLQWISEHTNGESLETNISLIKHNAALGASIASEYQ